jgi:hypothetical protein
MKTSVIEVRDMLGCSAWKNGLARCQVSKALL